MFREISMEEITTENLYNIESRIQENAVEEYQIFRVCRDIIKVNVKLRKAIYVTCFITLVCLIITFYWITRKLEDSYTTLFVCVSIGCLFFLLTELILPIIYNLVAYRNVRSYINDKNKCNYERIQISNKTCQEEIIIPEIIEDLKYKSFRVYTYIDGKKKELLFSNDENKIVKESGKVYKKTYFEIDVNGEKRGPMIIPIITKYMEYRVTQKTN